MEKTRRDFIKKLGTTGAGTMLLSMAPWLNGIRAEEITKKVSPSDKVRLGIIGVGSRGKKLLLHLQQVPDVEIAAICDEYPPHFERALELTNGTAKGYRNYKKLLDQKDLDGVIVATPIYNHPQITMEALDAGMHVFCEKAMSNTVEESKAMVMKSRAVGKNLQIGHQRMFDKKYLRALEMVKSGDFGPITHIRANWNLNSSWQRTEIPAEYEKKLNWRMYAEQCHGLMSELTCHINQVANWFLGQTPKFVSGTGSINYWKDGRTTYDNVHVMYHYPDGTNFTFNSILSNWHYGLEEQIMGPKNTFELESGKIYSQTPPPPPAIKRLVTDLEKDVFSTIPLGGASWIVNTGNTNKGEMIVDEYPLPNSTTLQLEAFAESIKRAKPMEEALKQGYWGTICAILGHEAIKTQKVIHFDESLNI
jgi:predicted dehydrogenase